tara:strand:+ start:236 stop:889 length:654 start_codon:yes stop_codon:yes gene_type:complete
MGEMLGYSIKKIYPNHKIITVIGKNQKKIPYSDISETYNFSKSSIMFNIIHCQLEIVKKYGPTLFLDTDMLLIKNINEFVELNKYDMSVTIRSEITLKTKLHEDHKIKFPKLFNKTFGEVMPYNAGIYFCKEKYVLEYMLNSFKKMPREYFRWYGDQIALNMLYKSNKFNIKIFQDNKYNFTPKSNDENISEKKILHFKGRRRNLFIPYFKKIFSPN